VVSVVHSDGAKAMGKNASRSPKQIRAVGKGCSKGMAQKL